MPLASAASSGSGGVVARLLSAIGRARRVPSKGWKVLSSKQAPRGLSKGKRCARTGVQGPDGRFRPVAAMLPTYVLPPSLSVSASGGEDGSSASSPPQLRPYVAEYPQEQLDAAVASLRARMAVQAARTERLDAERRTRALEAARRMRWEQQRRREGGGAEAPSLPPGPEAASRTK